MVRPKALSCEVVSTLEGWLSDHRYDDIRALSDGVRRLTTLFTRGREALSDGYLHEESLRRSYVAYFVPVNLGKIQAVLDEVLGQGTIPAGSAGAFRLLDVGSGPGSATLAALDWLFQRGACHERPVEALLVDRSRDALHDGQDLVDRYLRMAQGTVPLAPQGTPQAAQRHVKGVAGDLERSGWLKHLGGRAAMESTPFDLIIVANCLNELFRMARDPLGRRLRLVEALLGLLKDDGSLILIEPATRAESRSLLRL